MENPKYMLISIELIDSVDAVLPAGGDAHPREHPT